MVSSAGNPKAAPVAFIGGGNMATALIAGLIEKDFPASAIRVVDPVAEARTRLFESFGIRASVESSTALDGALTVVLAVKPQIMGPIARDLAGRMDADAVLASIAAGIPLDMLANWTRHAAIVRAMPNTPALVGQGATGLVASAATTPAQLTRVAQLFGAVGQVFHVPSETLMDAVTATSGSGPAYFFAFAEAMIAGACRAGLPLDTARDLVIQTLAGAAGMLAREPDPALLRQRVTSPGGSTAAALAVFASAGLEEMVAQALAAATTRGAELAAEAAAKSEQGRPPAGPVTG